jgi:uncharacterized protein
VLQHDAFHARNADDRRTAIARLACMIRELPRNEIEDLLRSEVFGRLGCHDRDRTYVVPMTFVYEDASIIVQTGDGQKVAMMRNDPNVCFEVDRVDTDGGWRSAIVFGRYEELSGESARSALQALMHHLDMTHRWRGFLPTHGAGRTPPGGPPGGRPEVMFRIAIEEMTGRAETVSWVPEVPYDDPDAP